MKPYDAFFGNLFGVRKSVRYHQRRRAFFEWTHTSTAALQVVAGSSAVASWIGEKADLGIGLAAFAALLAALDLVVGTSRRATLHAGLAQQFAQLERDMVPHELDREIDAETETGFRQRRLEIEEGEPPKLRVIDLLCHNELAAGVTMYAHATSYEINRLRRWIGHFVDLEVQDILDKPRKPGDTGSPPEPQTAAT